MKVTIEYIKEGNHYRVADLERLNYGQFEIIDEETFQRMLKCEFLSLSEVEE